ncbi:hypothetical protein SAMN05660909_02384 [Chitinophaga terrae (ex Kim and Jung 2007)]|jgi:hypothetical protein|uniref:GLPGLI family protein n=1 Tax=Chitinophaga terrae (ex Kim and Jung 2007) TaxID=408074 RepID=A0A1H4C1C4_9BACT|nr:hypothetical protein [Chitinophaga terrae (ex Kim and Jung 2007)]MDQ0108559.1 hypothetical protein [Chitinophaga terrae (ex Kim and Jung 2007)]GEP91971.1 hypothetical protein CTE07_36160 [Chitinophaga terrae (ex Kim and Jung 2007)]SEA54113.1 hypothetical protein SAMN05660909_02384 [Chitinophaga terrae (ex Kim and Jung 2007)]
MKTLLITLTIAVTSLVASAQVIKLKQPLEPITDSIIYQTDNVIIIFDRQELATYMTGMDTVLRNSRYDNKVFNSVQLSRFNKIDMANHFLKAYCYLEDTANKDFSYSTSKMNMLWAEDGGIMLPYVELLIPDLLAAGMARIIERSSKGLQLSYRMIAEPVNGVNYRTYRLNNGKEVFRESTFRAEQLTGFTQSR